MAKQPAKLTMAYTEIDLPFSKLPTREELENLAATSTDYTRLWAARTLGKIEQSGSLAGSYPFYPIQIWLVGNQPLFSLGGEVVVEYALALKKMYGQHVFVVGYANDLMAYIPSTRILKEDHQYITGDHQLAVSQFKGYEGALSQMYYDLPSTWDWSIEFRILDEVALLAKEVGLKTAQ